MYKCKTVTDSVEQQVLSWSDQIVTAAKWAYIEAIEAELAEAGIDATLTGPEDAYGQATVDTINISGEKHVPEELVQAIIHSVDLSGIVRKQMKTAMKTMRF